MTFSSSLGIGQFWLKSSEVYHLGHLGVILFWLCKTWFELFVGRRCRALLWWNFEFRKILLNLMGQKVDSTWFFCLISEQKEAVIKPITVLTSPDVGTAKPLCKTCNTEFLSRNQLFAHLKQSGHAQLKHMSVSSVKASSKKGKKKR